MLLDRATHYLTESTGLPVSPRDAADTPLPGYLAGRYRLESISVAGQAGTLVLLIDPDGFTPAKFEKHLAALHKFATGELYCLVAAELPAYLRARLVARQIPFMVPGQQLFWPALGAAVRKRAANRPMRPVSDLLKPATQLLVLMALTGRVSGPITARELTPLLGYTSMTLSRALDEIAHHELGEVVREGRERKLYLPLSRQMLWQRAEPLMQSPVQARIHVLTRTLPVGVQLLEAGESALARVSMLNPPGERAYAIGRETWSATSTSLEQVPFEDVDTCIIERWRYDPALLATAGAVDNFSLYLSLRHSTDERVLDALEALIKGAL